MTLTYKEQLLLSRLLEGPRTYRGEHAEQVLVRAGLARRVDQIEITSAGVDELGRLAKARGEPDDLYSGNHGF